MTMVPAKQTLTKQVLYSVLRDTYNRAKGRGHDQDTAAEMAQNAFDELLATIGGPNAWMNLPDR
jgi:hypothetical protein